jgi:preprotein translocase subunit YajC
MSLFDIIPSAQAQTTSAPAADGLSQYLQGPLPMIVAIGLVFYFLVFRPQQSRAKEHKKLLSDLKRGDNVITTGGIIGTVARVISDDEVSLEIAEGVRVRVVRSTITAVTGKGVPRSDVVDDADGKVKPVRRGKTPPAAKIAADESKPADA